jgi:flagellar M-ring protein FliF
VSALAQTLNNLGTGRVAAIIGVGIGLIAFFVFMTSRLGTPGGMVMLYGNLDPADSGQIAAKLESQQIPYELKAGGTQIFVPNEDAPRLRLSLNQEGLTGSGTIGYELFDDANALGTTSFVQRINQVRALEGELSRTIKSIDNVKNARVHIVLPQRELFSRDSKEPSASIVLKLSGRFSKAQVQAVQNLVASSVPGLTTARISIVDDKGNLLARGDASEGDGTATPADADELRNTYETRMAHTIEELIERSVGFGKVRAEVNADMDFDRIVTNSEIYDPNGQVVRSTQTVEEGANSTESDNASAITVADNLPNAQNEEIGGTGPTAASSSSRTEETVNFEISKTIKNHIRETGTINKLSVAVLVDGTYTTDADGNAIYEPRSEEELQQFGKLVRSTVGYDKKRGDIIEV